MECISIALWTESYFFLYNQINKDPTIIENPVTFRETNFYFLSINKW